MPGPRVISLLPSATEILCHVGGGHLLVGRSHECDFPTGVTANVPVLTAARTRFDSSSQTDRDVRAARAENRSLYSLDEDVLARLRPDVIITQDLCDVCSVDLPAVHRVAARVSPRPTVLSLNPSTVEDVLDDHLRVGEAAGLSRQAEQAVVRLRGRMYAAMDYVPSFAAGPVVAFLEWTDPVFIGGHWTPQLIERAGGVHPLNPTVAIDQAGAAAGPIGQSLRRAGKSVRVPAEAIVAIQPEFVFICPCGLSLSQTRAETEALAASPWWSDLPAVRLSGSGGHAEAAGGAGCRVAMIDGNQMFSRPGPRLIDAFEFLVAILNDRPEVVPADFPWAPFRSSGTP